jgi:hypothetical protein
MKKLSTAIFCLIISSFFCTSVAFAEDNPASNYTNQSLKEWATAKKCADNNGVCAEAYTNFMTNSLMYSMSNSITGAGDMSLAKTPEEVKTAFNKSALGTTGNFIAYMYDNPPASGIQYIASSLHNFSLGKSAYAQGIGFSGLQPLQPLWRAFRNLSYIVLVIVMVVIGFMIMFRMKLNAQTSISIQNALPNIIVTLILITFSYAIAGLLIDLMYFLINLIVVVFVNAGLGQHIAGIIGIGEPAAMNVTKYQEFYTNANLWDLLRSVVNRESLTALPSALMFSGAGNLFERIGTAQTVAGNIAQFFGLGAAGIVSFVGGALLSVLIALGLLFIFVRLFFMFLNSYIQILLSIILAPLQLLVGAVPGQNAFKNWFMGLVGNLIIFPSAVALFMLNMTICVMAIKESVADPSSGATIAGTDLWIPPFLFGRVQGSNVDASAPIALIGFGILMLTPTLLNTVKGFFAPKPFLPITPGIIASPLLSGVSTIGQLAQQKYYLGLAGQSIPGLNRWIKKPSTGTPPHP